MTVQAMRDIAHHTEDFAIHRFPDAQNATALPGPDAVGNKAHNLMRMARCKMPVPPGFVLGTDLCRTYLEYGDAALAGLAERLISELGWLADATGSVFGCGRKPLLVSVRSGAAISMPGMMETVLNIGLNDETVEGLIRATGNPRLAWDSYRRLITQYGAVVHDVPAQRFEAALARMLAGHEMSGAGECDTKMLRDLTGEMQAIFRAETGKAFPQDPMVQLHSAICAVLRSWSSARAIAYRRMHALPEDAGTATLIQQMVFGNAGGNSGAGVGFTRDPATGENKAYIDFLANAQGEDVVAGTHNALGDTMFAQLAPAAHRQLCEMLAVLEDEFSDMQDFEFTVERGRLHMLQTRSGKRTPLAALTIAIDLVDEGKISPEEAFARLADLALDEIELLSFDFDTDNLESSEGVKRADRLAQAVPASGPVTVGAIVFDPERLTDFHARGEPVILARQQASTDDITAIADAAGLITASGARTSHAAVVARQLGKVCLVGCTDMRIDADGRSAYFGETRIAEGEILSIDGLSGDIFRGALTIRRQRPEAQLARLAAWRAQQGSPHQN